MKNHFRFWRGMLFVVGAIVVVVVAYALTMVLSTSSAQMSVEKTRRALRQQGFKTDLADFNFSVPPEQRGFELALSRLGAGRRSWNQDSYSQSMKRMVPAGSNSALVAWKEDMVRCEPEDVPWAEFANSLEVNDLGFVALRAAALSGPIRFNLDASLGASMLMPQFASMKRAAFAFSAAMINDLHDENRDDAWTNLLAEARLVTAWKPEATQISHLVCFALMTIEYESTWEALQDKGWSDEQLAAFQREWEGVDFFKNLPETMAFTGASAVDACERERREPVGIALPELFKEMAHEPQYAPRIIKQYWSVIRYRSRGTYEDEKALLLFYRDRQLEVRNALQATSWSQMSKLPGVTTNAIFVSPYRSRFQAIINLRTMGAAVQAQGISLLARAMEAEERRRLILTAIALERFRIHNGKYPANLGELTPDWLKGPAIDLMDGQPLRYQPGQDGRFVLYSTGLDCADNGGIIAPESSQYPSNFGPLAVGGARPIGDLVWPRAATSEEAAALHAQELEERRVEAEQRDEQESDHYWNRTAKRQREAASTLASPPTVGVDLNINGHPLSERLRNPGASGTNALSLAEMLTLRPVITGDEPEVVTFEAPINYEAATNFCTVALYIDSLADDSDEGTDVGLMECSRATNGNCRLAWHTIFETPGKHTLLMGLELNEPLRSRVPIVGPPYAVEVTNLCQFSISSSKFDPAVGARLMAKLPERKADYSIEMVTPKGQRLKTISDTTSNGSINIFWDLIGDDGKKLSDESFNTVFHIKLTDSGRTQTLKGP